MDGGEENVSSRLPPTLTTGSYLALRFSPTVKIISPDVFCYLEDNLNTEINDLIIIKNGHLKPTGLVFAQASCILSSSQVAKLKEINFKKTKVDVRLIESPEAYLKFIDHVAMLKFQQIPQPPPFSEGVVFVKNFSNNDLNQLFSKYGEIISLENKTLSTGLQIVEIHYKSSSSAFKASKFLNRKNDMLVGAIAIRDAKQNLIFRKSAKNSGKILDIIKGIGPIESHRIVNQDMFVKMQDIFDAQVTCALLSAEKIPVSFVCL